MPATSSSGHKSQHHHGDGVLQCPICCDTLGLYGGPVTLPCGHNGCKDCLSSVAERSAQCPLCRRPFDRNLELRPNTELRDLISLATKLLNMDEQEHADGWEAFPSAALTAEQYATDLKSHKSHAHMGGAFPGQQYNPLPPSTRSGGAEGWGAGAEPSLLHAPSAPPLSAAGGEGPHAMVVHGGHGAHGCMAGFHEVLDMAPLPWLPDSLASACGGCARPFRPITRLRHHCRFCGRIFCGACSSQRALLPPKFCVREPQRVCDMCAASLAPLQQYLAGVLAPAAQAPVHDAHDWLALRAWLNSPYSSSLEGDVYKAANVIAGFTRTVRASPEAGLPTAVLAGARGLVALSCARVALGAGVATFGTGVVVSRGASGGWSAPCSVALAGLGWGLAVGAQLADVVLVLRTDAAVAAFSGAVHVGVGGNLSVAVGPVGRSADAALLVGSAAPGSAAAAYAYSCTRGAFFGISIDGTLLTVRDSVNAAFYGLPVTASQLLTERRVQPPPAAAALYDALRSMELKFENRRRFVHAPQRGGLPPATTPFAVLPASAATSSPATAATTTRTAAAGASGLQSLGSGPLNDSNHEGHLSASSVLGAQQLHDAEPAPSQQHQPSHPEPMRARPAHEVAAALFRGSSGGGVQPPPPPQQQQQATWLAGGNAWGYAAATPPAAAAPFSSSPSFHGQPPPAGGGGVWMGGGGGSGSAWGAASSGTWDGPVLSARAGAGAGRSGVGSGRREGVGRGEEEDEEGEEEAAAAQYMAALFDD